MNLFVDCYFTKAAFPIFIEDYLDNYEIDIRTFLKCPIIKFFLNTNHLITDNQFVKKWQQFNLNNILIYKNEAEIQKKLSKSIRSIIFCEISEKTLYENTYPINCIIVCVDDVENVISFFQSILSEKNFEIKKVKNEFITNWENFNLPITFIYLQHPYFFDVKFKDDLLDAKNQKKFISEIIQKIKIYIDLISNNQSNIKKLNMNILIAYFDKIINKYELHEQKEIIDNILSKLIRSAKDELYTICRIDTQMNIWSKMNLESHSSLKFTPHQRLLISDYFYLSSHIEFDKAFDSISYETIFTRPQNYLKKYLEVVQNTNFNNVE